MLCESTHAPKEGSSANSSPSAQQSSTSSLWFGRDVFGRRSLVWHLPIAEDDTVMLSSVGHFDPIDMPLVRLSISL